MALPPDLLEARNERFYEIDKPDDNRTRAQRDRDRILYTSAFRRLVGVTQVVHAGEGHTFHNRLTHTLEVAQIARRLAEKLIRDDENIANEIGGVDPDVVEAAALAHDLGHPPFGHIGEEELDELAKTEGRDDDGFEGNAQTFRIVTKLAVHLGDRPGLNLTRATLNAILKYPWFRQTRGLRQRKWGAFHTEEEEFRWARLKLYPGDERKSAEAELMDWADDIAYAVHDVEDFYRAGLVPLDRLGDPKEAQRFFDEVFRRWAAEERMPREHTRQQLEQAFSVAIGSSVTESFSGTRRQRAALRGFTASLIKRYVVQAIRLRVPAAPSQPRVEIEPDALREVMMLKELTWHYVIKNPALATQQHGQRQIIRELFAIFRRAAESEDRSIFPPGYREQLEVAEDAATRKREKQIARTRAVVDIIAGMTERSALEMHQRLTGRVSGSILDFLPK